MNLYKLIFTKGDNAEVFEENIRAVDDAEARTKASVILTDYPSISTYELYRSGEKITFTRDEG